MCVIITSQKGLQALLDKDILNAVTANPDGTSVTLWNEEKSLWEIATKFMVNPVNAVPSVRCLPQDVPFVFHARIATSGRVDMEHIHPFPVKDTGILVAHNGIFHGYDKTLSGEDTMDTIEFISRHSFSIEFGDRGLIEANAKGNRLAIMYPYAGTRYDYLEPHVPLLIGEFIEEDGVFFSNLYFRPHTHQPGGRYSPYRYDMDYYDTEDSNYYNYDLDLLTEQDVDQLMSLDLVFEGVSDEEVLEQAKLYIQLRHYLYKM